MVLALTVGFLERVLETGWALLRDCRFSQRWEGNGCEAWGKMEFVTAPSGLSVPARAFGLGGGLLARELLCGSQ